MDIHVKLIEGTLYKCDPKEAELVLTQQEWEEMDKAERYEKRKGALISEKEKMAEKPIPVYPPFPLDTMYEQEGVGIKQHIEALWDAVINKDRTKADEFIVKRLEVEKEYQKQLDLYEASK